MNRRSVRTADETDDALQLLLGLPLRATPAAFDPVHHALKLALAARLATPELPPQLWAASRSSIEVPLRHPASGRAGRAGHDLRCSRPSASRAWTVSSVQRARAVRPGGGGGRRLDTLLLDKAGTITLGDRQASEFLPPTGVREGELIEAARLSSLADETPEGRSIVELAGAGGPAPDGEAVPFTAQTKLSGIDVEGRAIRKGALDAVLKLSDFDEAAVSELRAITDRIARAGGTPHTVAEGTRLLGAIHFKGVIKAGIMERFAELRRMGIRTVMITGDNPLTAAIAADSCVDDFLAEATP